MRSGLEVYTKLVKLILKCTVGFLLFLTTFVGSVEIRDRAYEAWVKNQVARVVPGMTDKQVISIIGKPTSYHMSDEPGSYWCYGSNSFNSYEEYCGKVMLLMGTDNRVIRVGEVIP